LAPEFESREGEFVGVVETSKDEAVGGEVVLGFGTDNGLGQEVGVVGLVTMGEVNKAFSEKGLLGWRGEDGVGDDVVVEGRPERSGKTEIVDLEWGGMVGENGESVAFGKSSEVNEDVNIV